MYAWAGISASGFDNQFAGGESNQQALDFLKNAVDKKHIPSMIEMGLLYSTEPSFKRTNKKHLSIGLWLKDWAAKKRLFA